MTISFPDASVLFFAGMTGGAINAVAGGGSFVSFPALLVAGVRPVTANATNTLVLWLGTVASTRAYRTSASVSRRLMMPFLAASVLGGIAGAAWLIRTEERTFVTVLPWLLLFATLLFAFGGRLTKRLARAFDGEPSARAICLATLFEFLAAIYGGYFGGGLGIINLAMFSLLGMTDIHAMNRLKVILGSVINGVATAVFVFSGAISWPEARIMLVGAMIGGYGAAKIAQRVPQIWVRRFVILTALMMTAYFFRRAYR